MTTGRKLLVVCGVRPHYVKWAGLRRAIAESVDATQVEMIDARQHFDPELTDLLLRDLSLRPNRTIEHDSDNPHDRGGRIYSALCKLFEMESSASVRSPVVAAFGDVTSTVMTAVAASRAGCSLIHVEAGVRSVEGASGESVENRVRRLTAQISSLNLCVLPAHVDNLVLEHAPGRSAWVGDLGRQLLLEYAGPAEVPGSFVLAHIHKSENTTVERIRLILRGLAASGLPVKFIVHTSVRRLLDDHGVPAVGPTITLVPPMSYRALARTMAKARLIFTDSGGVQREAYHLRKRCVVRRDTVGWSELLQHGGHLEVAADEQELADGVRQVWEQPTWTADHRPAFDKKNGCEEAALLIREVLQHE